MGLGIGVAMGCLLWVAISPHRLTSIILLLPMLVDVTSQQSGHRQSTNPLRLCTGLLGGIGTSGLVMLAVHELTLLVTVCLRLAA
jgi:uncharacterized membrane protein